MGYIYIFVNKKVPNCVALGYTDNWKKSLEVANLNYKIDTPFEPYLFYEVNFSELNEPFNALVSTLFRDLYLFHDLYYLTKDTAVEFVKSIARARNELDKVRICPSEKEKELTQSPINKKEESKAINSPVMRTIETAEDESQKTKTPQPKEVVIKEQSKKYALAEIEKNSEMYGYKLYDNVKYGRKKVDSGKNYYWITMKADFVDSDWSIILDDEKNKTMYLLNIPAKTFNSSDFALVDPTLKNRLFYIYIAYKDENFTDINQDSKHVRFKDYLVATIKYGNSSSLHTSGHIKEKKVVEDGTKATIVLTPYKGKPPKIEKPQKQRTEPSEFYNLNDDTNYDGSIPKTIVYDGLTYEVESFYDIVNYAAKLFPNVEEEKVLNFIKKNYTLFSGRYFSDEKRRLRNPLKISKYDIYAEADIPGNAAIEFVKWLADEAGIGPTLFSFSISTAK